MKGGILGTRKGARQLAKDKRFNKLLYVKHLELYLTHSIIIVNDPQTVMTALRDLSPSLPHLIMQYMPEYLGGWAGTGTQVSVSQERHCTKPGCLLG